MQGNISEWKKKEGEEIAAGDVLCEVETDKVRCLWITHTLHAPLFSFLSKAVAVRLTA